MSKLFTIFKIPELRMKIFITLLFLFIYRVGFHIPLPIIDQQQMFKSLTMLQNSTLGQVLSFIAIFSGGSFTQSSIFSLGIMPYISAAIIFPIFASLYPPLEKVHKA